MNFQKYVVIFFFILISTSVWSESIDIVGTGDGMPILKNLATSFQAENPDHQINVPDSIGSSGGIKLVGNDKNKLGRVARIIKEREKNFNLNYLPIARFPVVFFVNGQVDVDDLSTQQVLDIYSGKVTNWSEVGGNSGKIRVIRREPGDSSLNNLEATFPGFSDITITRRSRITTTTLDNINIVSTKRGTIGFGPYSDAVKAKIKILTIDGLKPEDIAYPSYGTLALIFKDSNNNGIVGEFLNFLATPAAAEAVKEANAVPLL